jgi:hypothetical protein
MPPMLREEAFHLAAGVVPLRRWMEGAARGDPLIPVAAIQHAFNKWVPRGLEMFGDERGGESNLRLGFKDRKNREAQSLYYAELERLVRDLDLRYLRARDPDKSAAQAEEELALAARGESPAGGWVAPEDLLRLPHREFFRRRGEPAYRMVGVGGESFTDPEVYLRHVAEQLPEAYRASRDLRDYAEALRAVAAGTLTPEAAAKQAPRLARAAAACPCSNAVRWVSEGPLVPDVAGAGAGAAGPAPGAARSSPPAPSSA